jgi:hypothetical protein
MSELTFSDFAKLANKRGLTPQCLAERFANKIERSGEFFYRVFKAGYGRLSSRIEACSLSAFNAHQDSTGRTKVCACGCGQSVFDRQKWASPGCRQRVARKRMAALGRSLQGASPIRPQPIDETISNPGGGRPDQRLAPWGRLLLAGSRYSRGKRLGKDLFKDVSNSQKGLGQAPDFVDARL